MRPLYDEFDDFDFDDSAVMARLRREQNREQRRLANRRKHKAADHHRDLDSYGDIDDLEGYGSFEDYDASEFDEHSDLTIDH